MTTRTTHTYAFLEVKPATFEEIAAKLRSAGYDHAFDADAQHGELIDLHGLALVVDPEHRERHLAHVPFRALCELEEKRQKTTDNPEHCSCLTCLRRAIVLAGGRAVVALERGQSSVRHALPEVDNPFAHEPVDRLLRFKAYVHERLDQMNVPADPEPAENAKHGCRIEGRLNWIISEMIDADEAREQAEQRAERLEFEVAALRSKLGPSRCSSCGLDPSIKNQECEACRA